MPDKVIASLVVLAQRGDERERGASWKPEAGHLIVPHGACFPGRGDCGAHIVPGEIRLARRSSRLHAVRYPSVLNISTFPRSQPAVSHHPRGTPNDRPTPATGDPSGHRVARSLSVADRACAGISLITRVHSVGRPGRFQARCGGTLAQRWDSVADMVVSASGRQAPALLLWARRTP